MKNIQPFSMFQMYANQTPTTLIMSPSSVDIINFITELHVNSIPIKFFLPERFGSDNEIYFNSGYWKKEDFTFYRVDEFRVWKNIGDILKSQYDYYQQHKKINYLHLVLELKSIDFKQIYIIDLMMNARNLGIQVTLIVKHLISIPPSIRSQLDYVLLDWYNQSCIHNYMYQYFGFFLQRQTIMNNLLLDAYQLNCLMVIDMKNQSPKIEDKILMYLKI